MSFPSVEYNTYVRSNGAVLSYQDTPDFTINGVTCTGLITAGSSGSIFTIIQRSTTPPTHNLVVSDTLYVTPIKNPGNLPMSIRQLANNAPILFTTVRNISTVFLTLTNSTPVIGSTVDLTSTQSNIYITFGSLFLDVASGLSLSKNGSQFNLDGPNSSNSTNVVGQIEVTNTNVNANFFPVFVTSSASSPGAFLEVSGNISLNPNTSTVTATNFAGTSTFSAATLVNESGANTNFFPVFVPNHALTSQQTMTISSSITNYVFNPLTGALGVTSIVTNKLGGGAAPIDGSNLALGNAALSNGGVTGIQNTVVGQGAGNGALTGNNNTIMGYQAGQSLTGGALNVMIGFRAGALATTANNNVLIGEQAGKVITSSGSNTVVGFEAGFNLTTGAGNNIVLGQGAGSNLGADSNNIDIASLAVSGDTANVRIGVPGTHLRCWIPMNILNTVVAHDYSVTPGPTTIARADLVSPTGGLITSLNVGAVALTMPTGADLTAVVLNVNSGDSFQFTVANASTSTNAVTISGGVGTTIPNGAAIVVAVGASYIVTCINAGPGVNATSWNIY